MANSKSSPCHSTGHINEQLPDKLQDIFLSQAIDKEDAASGKIDEKMLQTIKKWRLIIQTVLLLIAVFSAHSCFSLPISFFPQKAKELGLTEIEIGAVFSFYPAFECLMSPVYGTLVSLSCYIAIGQCIMHR